MEKNIYEAFEKLFQQTELPYKNMLGKTILITGAGGLIGSMLIRGLCVINDMQNLNLRILALVRNEKSMLETFRQEVENGVLHIVTGDICDKFNINEDIHYIIHGASMTASKSFVENPVEVIMTNVNGTHSALEFACRKKVHSIAFLSTMEVYGFTEKEEVLTEDNVQYLNPLSIRSCYPESKRMAENLCMAYFSEYGVPVKIIRLAQCFGYGVKKDDTRVFGEFARCVEQKKDIVLLTDGKSKRMYLDTLDAVTAILTVLLSGSNGEAYNAANKSTYCSVREMAELVANNIANGDIDVLIQENSDASQKFSPPHRLFLDTSKIESLGWKAEAGMDEMYRRIMEGSIK